MRKTVRDEEGDVRKGKDGKKKRGKQGQSCVCVSVEHISSRSEASLMKRSTSAVATQKTNGSPSDEKP